MKSACSSRMDHAVAIYHDYLLKFKRVLLVNPNVVICAKTPEVPVLADPPSAASASHRPYQYGHVDGIPHFQTSKISYVGKTSKVVCWVISGIT